MDKIFEKIISFDKTDAKIGILSLFFSILTFNYLFFENNSLIQIFFFFCSLALIWTNPRIGILASILTIMVFGENFSLLPWQIGKLNFKIFFLDMVLLVVFLFWILQSKLGKRIDPVSIKDKKKLWLAIYFVVLILALLKSFFSGGDSVLAVGTFKNYSYVLLYFLALKMFNSWKEVIRVLRTLFVGGILIIGFIFWGFLAGKGLWTEGTPGLRYLSGLHTYYISFLLIMIFVLSAWKDYFLNRITTGLILSIHFFGLIGSMFRHLWLGIISAFIFIWYLMKKSERKNILVNLWKLCFSFLIVAVILLWLNSLFGNKIDYKNNSVVLPLFERVNTLSQTGYEMESAASWRLAAWKASYLKYLESPILGVGLGQKIYLDFGDFIDIIDVRNIHNDVLSIFFQTGIIGFFPFLIFHILLISKLLKTLKKSDEFRQMLLISLGFMVVAMFGAFFAVYIAFTGTAIFYWMIMALASIIIDLSLKNEKYNNHNI
jgi:O-antigen ligase